MHSDERDEGEHRKRIETKKAKKCEDQEFDGACRPGHVRAQGRGRRLVLGWGEACSTMNGRSELECIKMLR